ncbi:hypothetical protein BGZ57DRAFT_920225 [Hyaloscypha finlandica]|nr:hypothetical protein BGZ57DRAFT_920225 [Hyaloscypha finlandica]
MLLEEIHLMKQINPNPKVSYHPPPPHPFLTPSAAFLRSPALIELLISIYDSDDTGSDVSDTIFEPFEEDGLPSLPDDTLEDLTGPINDLLSDEGSLSPLTLDDGTPSAKPRPYQLEMVQESLNKNIIIAMDTGSGRTHWYFCP